MQFHYELDRRLTVRECARLQTFPDSFVFPHSATSERHADRECGSTGYGVQGGVVDREFLAIIRDGRGNRGRQCPCWQLLTSLQIREFFGYLGRFRSGLGNASPSWWTTRSTLSPKVGGKESWWRERGSTSLWSGDNVAASERVLEVVDNGQGMEFESITNAVKAGYTSNDPTSSLGLFGMGFNIATAKAWRDDRRCSSARAEDERMDRGGDRLRHSGEEGTPSPQPVVRREKMGTEQSGTKVQVSKLKEGVYRHLRDRSRDLKRTLEDVYAPILREGVVSIFINGMVLNPRPYCTSGEKREAWFAGRKESPHRVRIDRDLGSALFDVREKSILAGSSGGRLQGAEGGRVKISRHGIIERPRRTAGLDRNSALRRPERFRP